MGRKAVPMGEILSEPQIQGTTNLSGNNFFYRGGGLSVKNRTKNVKVLSSGVN